MITIIQPVIVFTITILTTSDFQFKTNIDKTIINTRLNNSHIFNSVNNSYDVNIPSNGMNINKITEVVPLITYIFFNRSNSSNVNPLKKSSKKKNKLINTIAIIVASIKNNFTTNKALDNSRAF